MLPPLEKGQVMTRSWQGRAIGIAVGFALTLGVLVAIDQAFLGEAATVRGSPQAVSQSQPIALPG